MMATAAGVVGDVPPSGTTEGGGTGAGAAVDAAGDDVYLMVTPAHVLDLQAAYTSRVWLLPSDPAQTPASTPDPRPSHADGSASGDEGPVSCLTTIRNAYQVRAATVCGRRRTRHRLTVGALTGDAWVMCCILHEPTPGREASQRTVASPVLSEVRAWPPWQDSDAPTTCNAGVRWRFEAWRRMRTQRRVPQVLCRGRAMTRTACVAACDAQGLAALPSLRRRHTHQRVWQRGGPLGSAPGVAGEVRCHTLRTCALRGAAGGHHATPGPCVGRIESTAGRGGVPFDTVPGSTVALRGPTGGWAPYCAAPAEDATVGVSCAATSQVGGCLFHLALPTGASVHTQCGAQRLTCARSLAGCEASRRRCHPARAAQHGTGGAQRCCGTVRCVVAWQRPQSMGMYVRVSWGPQHTNSVGRVRAEAVPRRAPRFSRRSSLPTQTRTSKCGRSSLLTSKTD